MKTYMHIIRLLIAALVMGLMSSVAFALAPPERPPVDELAPLKDAIQLAGVEPLSSFQEISIQALIDAFKNTHDPSSSAIVQEARAIYENAILFGDAATAESQAEILWKDREAELIQREKDDAAFAIDVIAILRTNPGQIEGLTLRIGISRLVRLAISLVERSGHAGFEPPVIILGFRGFGSGVLGFGFSPRGFGAGSRGTLPPNLNQ
jgi:hypothetical protein